MSLSDEMLIAYADGELPQAQRAAVEAAAAADPELAARLRAHQALAEQVRGTFAKVAEEPAPERLLAAVRAGSDQGADIIAFPARRPASGGARWAGLAALAASLVVGVIIGRAALQGETGLVGDDMAARGALAQALNTQLASAAGPSTVKIGITFRATDGSLCRTFETGRARGLAGLACRDGGEGWLVRMSVPAQGSADTGAAYRTAASSLPVPVAELAQSLAAAPPLGPTEEAEARARGWR